ncbi:MAG: cofactor-independent phosphoglycerate mutase [Pelotomaculum sp.]|uniref:Predicted phosphoglycerate mutase n=1 Tax=Pelotomaculum thermopropionicum (strain DSM 13744 / JCM 10971 / SI) TaxID=370438 RepID=A5D1T5_PELTS|nr:cofactor-independent phosphoglycerate mutase [Pelotomaculum sp.]BAF59779.1 predicted phosphoglycerate mutase [Pelotomaculum thermopropionicum SI]
MKYVILLGDGMADEKIAELDGKTPLQYASTPNMDRLAAGGETGMVHTVPDGFPPGSDVANLSVMGYNPREYYTGRSPLEAVSMGVELSDDDVAFRCNLVTLSEEEVYENKIMVDYSSDEITTSESHELIREVANRLGSKELRFYPGFGFRHLLVWKTGPVGGKLTPPHDISGRTIAPYLPKGEGSDTLKRLMKESNRFLPEHPVNQKRVRAGLRPATSIWFWGQGKKPSIPKFYDKYGVTGSVISAVDLIKGIGICAGFDIVKVEGVTGTIHTNFRGKVQAALEELKKGKDLVYIHVEAPDAASHRGETVTKVKAIEMVDNMLGQLLNKLDEFGMYKIMLLPDHPTPLSTKTHSNSPVPFVIYAKGRKNKSAASFDEETAAKSGLVFRAGHELMDYFIRS